MPNVVANRISSALDLHGPVTLSQEDGSGSGSGARVVRYKVVSVSLRSWEPLIFLTIQ